MGWKGEEERDELKTTSCHMLTRSQHWAGHGLRLFSSNLHPESQV